MMAALPCTRAAYILLVFSSVGVSASLESLVEAFGSDSQHRCPNSVEYSSNQESLIDALDGKMVVFIGDSITRYMAFSRTSRMQSGRCCFPICEVLLVVRANSCALDCKRAAIAQQY